MDIAFALLPMTLVILAVVALWLFTRRRNRLHPEAVATLNGFGGWLLLLAVVQWLLALRALGGFVVSIYEYFEYAAVPMPGVQQALIVTAVLGSGMLAFVAYVTFTMMTKRRAFPGVFRIELLLITVFPLALKTMIALLTGQTFQLPPVLIQMAVTSVGATMWFLYSLNSIRVRNTFVK